MSLPGGSDKPISAYPLVPGDVVIASGGPLFDFFGPKGFILDEFSPQHAMIVAKNDGTSQFAHSAASTHLYNIGVTLHSGATALALSRDASETPLEPKHMFMLQAIVFKHIDPGLPPLIANIATRFASQKIESGSQTVPATTHRVRRTKAEMNAWVTYGGALYRILRAHDRYLTGKPLSKMQGVGCAHFTAICIQQAILLRIFPKGVPESLLNAVREMEKLKEERQKSKFSDLLEAPSHLRNLIEIFEKELAAAGRDMPASLKARYVDILFQTPKQAIDGFSESFISSGLLRCSGMLIHDGTGKGLACIRPSPAEASLYVPGKLMEGVMPQPIVTAEEKIAVTESDDYVPKIRGSIVGHIALRQFDIDCGLAKIQMFKELEAKLDPPSPEPESSTPSISSFESFGLFRFRIPKKDQFKQLMNIEQFEKDAIDKISGAKGLKDAVQLTKINKLFNLTVKLIKEYCSKGDSFDSVGAKQLLDHQILHFKAYVESDLSNENEHLKALIKVNRRLDRALHPEKYEPPRADGPAAPQK